MQSKKHASQIVSHSPHSKTINPHSHAKKTRGHLDRPVFLIGFMGAGKSSVARKLARKCSISSVDMDKYIERNVGKSITEIFADVGESGFREIETSILRDLSSNDYPMVISCGGGVIVKPDNIDLMREAGYVIFLNVDVDEASHRIKNKSSRPLFQDLESARARLNERLPEYRRAAHREIDTSGKDVHAIANEVEAILMEEGVLCQQQR